MSALPMEKNMRSYYRNLCKLFDLPDKSNIELEIDKQITIQSPHATWVFFIGESSNGRTPDFDSVYLGSNPSSPGSSII